MDSGARLSEAGPGSVAEECSGVVYMCRWLTDETVLSKVEGEYLHSLRRRRLSIAGTRGPWHRARRLSKLVDFLLGRRLEIASSFLDGGFDVVHCKASFEASVATIER
jgi:hypothetical protein